MIDDRSNPAARFARSSGSSPAADASQSDEALLDRVRLHNHGAMAAIFDRYGTMVYSIALRVLKDPPAAEDVMQQILFDVWENPHRFVSGRGSFAGWLAVITRNRAVDVLRRRKPVDSIEDVAIAAAANLADEAERNIMMDKIRIHLERLPSEQQRPLELAYFEGLSHSEIAELTGVPLGTVKTRIRSALISLREAVQI